MAKPSSLGHYVYFYVPLNFKAYIQMALLVLLYAFPINLQSWLVSTSISKQQTCHHFQNSFTTLVRDPQNICHSVLLLFFSLPISLKGHLTPASFSSSLQTPCLAFTALALPYPLAWKCSSKVTNCFLEITKFGGPLLTPFQHLAFLI